MWLISSSKVEISNFWGSPLWFLPRQTSSPFVCLLYFCYISAALSRCVSGREGGSVMKGSGCGPGWFVRVVEEGYRTLNQRWQGSHWIGSLWGMKRTCTLSPSSAPSCLYVCDKRPVSCRHTYTCCIDRHTYAIWTNIYLSLVGFSTVSACFQD